MTVDDLYVRYAAISGSIRTMRSVRDALARANAPKTLDRARHLLKSMEGAERNAWARFQRAKRAEEATP